MGKRYNSYYRYAGLKLSVSLDKIVRREFFNSEYSEPVFFDHYDRLFQSQGIVFLYTKFRYIGIPLYQVVPAGNYSDISMETSILIERLNKFFRNYFRR